MEARHELYIQRCLDLAMCAGENTAPNPLVGSVIVYEGKIIGEGYHRKYGDSHAEVNAINSVDDPALLEKSTLYVNLEPCSHFGKTPPCADLIVQKKIPRVVIGMQDPNPEVSGKGIRRLQDNGVEVISGILAEACYEINRPFITFHTLHRPFITLKWARSIDGYIDSIRINNQQRPVKITHPHTDIYTHTLRSQHMAIMAGSRTVLLDDPVLSVRHIEGRQPVKILVDRELQLPAYLKIFHDQGPVRIYNLHRDETTGNITYIRIPGKYVLEEILADLYRQKIQSVLVEGGSILIRTFLEAGLWDEIIEITGQVSIPDGVPAPFVPEHILLEEQVIAGDHIRRLGRKKTI